MNLSVSVIMSVFNNEKTVKAAIESILNQEFEHFEFLIIDDCSSDNTLEILEEYKYDERVKVYKNNKNIGLTKSLNYLISKAKGKYIFRQDGDDESFPKRFTEQLKILENKKYQVCTSRAIVYSNKKTIPGFSSFVPKKITMRFKNPYIHGTLAIDRKVLQKIGCYDEDYYYSQDFKLYVDLIKNNIKIYEIKKPLYFLKAKNNISTDKKEQQKYYFEIARNEFIRQQ